MHVTTIPLLPLLLLLTAACGSDSSPTGSDTDNGSNENSNLPRNLQIRTMTIEEAMPEAGLLQSPLLSIYDALKPSAIGTAYSTLAQSSEQKIQQLPEEDSGFWKKALQWGKSFSQLGSEDTTLAVSFVYPILIGLLFLVFIPFAIKVFLFRPVLTASHQGSVDIDDEEDEDQEEQEEAEKEESSGDEIEEDYDVDDEDDDEDTEGGRQ